MVKNTRMSIRKKQACVVRAGCGREARTPPGAAPVKRAVPGDVLPHAPGLFRGRSPQMCAATDAVEGRSLMYSP